MGQESICGVAVVTNCPEIQIQEVKAIDFLTKWIDGFASLCEQVERPKLGVSLFDPVENHPSSIVIVPVGISNIVAHASGNASSTGFTFRLQIATNESTKAKAFAELLAMIKLSVNFVDIMQTKLGLTYSLNLAITNSNEATLAVTLNKLL